MKKKVHDILKPCRLLIAILCISLIFAGISIKQSSAAIVEKVAIVGIWLFDKNEGNIAKDSSGNGHDGEIIGNIGLVEGQFGKALSFPGAGGNRVKIPHKDSLSLDTWSVTMWVKLMDTGNWLWWFSKESQFDGPRNYFFASNPQGIVYAGFHSSKSYIELTSKTQVLDDKWHHLAATYNKEKARLYIDGTLELEKSVTDAPVTNKSDIIIGERMNNDNFIKGIIDELGLFNRGLTEDEVNNIKTKGLEETIGLAVVSTKGSLTTTWGKIKEIK
jgi:large repetitive protein